MYWLHDGNSCLSTAGLIVPELPAAKRSYPHLVLDSSLDKMNTLESFATSFASAIPSCLFSNGTNGTQKPRYRHPFMQYTLIERLTKNFRFLHSSPKESYPSGSHAYKNHSKPEHTGSVSVFQAPFQADYELSEGGLKRKRSFEDNERAGKKTRTLRYMGKQSENTKSIYSRYRTYRPCLPEGGQRFQESHLYNFLDVQEHNGAVFVLVEWEETIQGSRFSWEVVFFALPTSAIVFLTS